MNKLYINADISWMVVMKLLSISHGVPNTTADLAVRGGLIPSDTNVSPKSHF